MFLYCVVNSFLQDHVSAGVADKDYVVLSAGACFCTVLLTETMFFYQQELFSVQCYLLKVPLQIDQVFLKFLTLLPQHGLLSVQSLQV